MITWLYYKFCSYFVLQAQTYLKGIIKYGYA